MPAAVERHFNVELDELGQSLFLPGGQCQLNCRQCFCPFRKHNQVFRETVFSNNLASDLAIKRIILNQVYAFQRVRLIHIEWRHLLYFFW
jgi:hypothetical protein